LGLVVCMAIDLMVRYILMKICILMPLK
jgi:hypothetical protein